MMFQKIFEGDNLTLLKFTKPVSVDLVYADMIFDDFNFDWIDICYLALKSTGSMFIHTDYRSVAEVKIYAEELFRDGGVFDMPDESVLKEPGGGRLNNWIIWPYDWGGRPKTAFGRKHDDILWFVKSESFKFYPKRVSIPKKTASSKKFNPSGRTKKIPTDVWSDIGNFLTTSEERIRDEDGVGIAWQKPERLIERIILATTDEGDLVVDPFLGTGTTAAVCKRLGRSILGFDNDPEMIDITCDRIHKVKR